MAKAALPKWLVWRGDRLHFYRRVPARYATLDKRRFIMASCETDDIGKAVVARDRLNALAEEYWRALARGEDPNAREKYLAAIDRARLEGFSYMPAGRLLDAPDDELIRRLLALGFSQGVDDRKLPTPSEKQATEALLGLVREPGLTLSTLVETYEHLTRDERRNKSDGQIHKWRLPRTRAVTNFVEVIGDIPVSSVTRAHALEFRDWWYERVVEEALAPETANKDLVHIGKMISVISDRHDLNMAPRFKGLLLQGDGEKKRPPFSTDHIRNVLLRTGALDGLNGPARGVVLTMINTGARPSELTGLRPEDIRLEGPIPHISIESYPGRVLKTRFSKRTLPLVGPSLEGAILLLAGAGVYKDRGGSLSGTANKFLDENGLLETEAHVVYSLRHSFKDRLTAVDAPDLIDSSLMGHKFDRPGYGDGPTLEKKLEWIEKIAIYRPA